MSVTRRKPYQGAEASAEGALDASPFGGDLDAELAAAPRRGGMSKLTMALGAGVILVAGVIIGIQVQKTFGGTTGARQSGAVAVGQGGQAGGTGAGQGATGRRSPGQGGFGGGYGNATIGTVKRIDGDKIYVETAQGETITVQTSGDTRIQVTKTGKVADLDQGGTVVVQGERTADGVVNATSVSQGGAGFRGGFGGGRIGGGTGNGG
ncbi:hypothetical protein AB0K60_35265 [Thermopolyspora sp. NPDC052614]|uniref:hypothetical protein n=1 Tax=Thermopolyspora sp. NPDC052614 TaxID=3155682 RepID=UPI00341CA08D